MQSGAEVMKPGKKPGKTPTGLVTESMHCPESDTTNLTLKVPAAVKVWVGLARLDVLLTPLAGSPKSQKWVVGLPVLWSVNVTVKPSQVIGIKFGLATSGVQKATFKCSSFRDSAIYNPFLNSFTSTHITYSPGGGAIPLIIPVIGSMVTPAPRGCTPE